MRVEVYVESRDRKDRVDDLLDAAEGAAEVELVVPAEVAEKYRYLCALGYEESGKDIVCFHRAAQ